MKRNLGWYEQRVQTLVEEISKLQPHVQHLEHELNSNKMLLQEFTLELKQCIDTLNGPFQSKEKDKCRRCGNTDLMYEEGFPGETLTFCTKCKETVGGMFNGIGEEK